MLLECKPQKHRHHLIYLINSQAEKQNTFTIIFNNYQSDLSIILHNTRYTVINISSGWILKIKCIII
jgi:hypothetical protein